MDILLPSLSVGMVDRLAARSLKSEGDDVVKSEPISGIETDKAMMKLMAEASGRRVFAAPLARRLARTGRIDLAALSGSSRRGRVVRNDVQHAMSKRGQSLRHTSAPAPEKQADLVCLGAHDRLPHSDIRSTITRWLLHSKITIPHFYLEADVEASALLALRAEINAIRPEEKISINDLMTIKISDELHSFEIDGKAGDDRRERPASSRSRAGISMAGRKCSAIESLNKHFDDPTGP